MYKSLHRSCKFTCYFSRKKSFMQHPQFFVILTFRQGDKRARCEHCNPAFMHFLFEIFALFETNFAGRKTWNFYSGGQKKWEMLAATKIKMSARDKKPTGTLDFSRSPLQFFFPVSYTFLKDFSYLFGAKFTGGKINRWPHDYCLIVKLACLPIVY